MFFFGEDTTVAVNHYINKSRKYGPPYAEGPISEMSQWDAREAYVHTRIAYKLARREDASQEILDALADEILEAFRVVIAYSDDIAKAVEERRLQPLGRKFDEFRAVMEEVRHPS